MKNTNVLSAFLPPSCRINDAKSLSATCYRLACALKDKKAVSTIITPDMATARELQHGLHFFAPNYRAHIFPDWETLPYDHFSPHQDIISERLYTLYQLPLMREGVILLPVSTLCQRLAPTHYVQSTSLVLQRGQSLHLNSLQEQLNHCGYQRVEQVLHHGEFAMRGSLLDIYPMGAKTPCRIDLFDDEVDSLRYFDPESQRSFQEVDSIRLLPAREFPFTNESVSHFRQQWRSQFSGNPTQSPIYEAISAHTLHAGIEYYLPLFFEETATFFDYLPKESQLIWVGEIDPFSYWETIWARYEQYRHDITRPLLAPELLFLSPEQLKTSIHSYHQMHCPIETSSREITLDTVKKILASNDQRLLFCTESLGHREKFIEHLVKENISPAIMENWEAFFNGSEKSGIIISPLFQGVDLPGDTIHLVTEQDFATQISLPQTEPEKSALTDANNLILNLTELSIGNPVVHINHGVGRYLGLQMLMTGDIEAEYVTLEYANNNKLYVPITDLHLIHRYTGAAQTTPLHTLGSEQWEKIRKKAQEKTYDVAAELLEVYAHRAQQTGFQFSHPNEAYTQFANAFPFTETPDQMRAINDVIDDLNSEKTMDRLVCGDVGFGKTEVAMRAAFIAVYNKKQVGILVPTTLLAQQHFETFTDRFANFAVNIEVLSRFRSLKEQKEVIEKLKHGKVDIIIATHKLLQKDIAFQDLGLLIVDEEHRFGVRQKERIKALRTHVDILTLTATPIPRTLNMAVSALRDLSIIGTPPARRLAIKTFVHSFEKLIISEAITRELMRGGQVYFLHNNVKTIEQRTRELAGWLPQAKVQFAHGQMRELELEMVMSDFYHQRFNVLVCTTIIETGIDIPNANTIIIERADKLGLAQLHQLRGRVGRSHHQAYAYLLIPHPDVITKEAQKRLEAITSLEELGAGFVLATHDLEIRGAGELLGEAQSGQIHAVGFNFYMEMLEQAIKSLKQNEQRPSADNMLLTQPTQINLNQAALIPSDYITDVHTRLVLYKRIANASDIKTLDDLQIEMIDRFGLLPPAAKQLFSVTEIKLAAEKLGIEKIDISDEKGLITFAKNPRINLASLINLIQTKPNDCQLQDSETLSFQLNEDVNPIKKLNEIFNTLTSPTLENA